MAVEVEKLIVTLEARLDHYEANMRRGQQITSQRLEQMEGRFALFGRNLRQTTSTAALGVGSALAGIRPRSGAADGASSQGCSD